MGSLADMHVTRSSTHSRGTIKLVKRSAPDTEQWIRDTATMWSRREDFNNYIDAYRLAQRGSRAQVI